VIVFADLNNDRPKKLQNEKELPIHDKKNEEKTLEPRIGRGLVKWQDERAGVDVKFLYFDEH
jgi:hypothetical protein